MSCQDTSLLLKVGQWSLPKKWKGANCVILTGPGGWSCPNQQPGPLTNTNTIIIIAFPQAFHYWAFTKVSVKDILALISHCPSLKHRHWHDHHQSDQGQCSGADSVILTWVAPGLRLNGSIGGLAATSMSQYSGFGSAAAVSTEFHQKTGNLRFSSPEGFAMLGVTLMGGLCVQVRACHLRLPFLFIFCSEN